MDPKKVVILIVLLLGLVVVGRWAYKRWEYYNPPPQPMMPGMMMGYGKAPGMMMGKGPGMGKAPGAAEAPAPAK